MFVGVIFRSCSNAHVRRFEYYWVIFDPIFGHIELVKITSLIFIYNFRKELNCHIESRIRQAEYRRRSQQEKMREVKNKLGPSLGIPTPCKYPS